MSQHSDQIHQISRSLGLTHIGSNISVLPILEEIYATKQANERVILDNAHAHLAHLIVRLDYTEDIFGNKIEGAEIAEALIRSHGIHCDRRAGCDASGGSLGHGIGISIGCALAEPDNTIHCIVSDGSMMEGSNWEALRICHDLDIKNIKIYVNGNGYSAVSEVDNDYLEDRMRRFWFKGDIKFYETDNGEGFDGVAGHYKKL